MAHITVIDSIMGSGKSTWMMDHINQYHTEDLAQAFMGNPSATERRYLYITPLLEEVDRVIAACPDLDFRDPQPIEGKKYYDLENLLRAGHNICTTHSLFQNLTRATYEMLKTQGYTLVCDEVLSCVEMYDGIKKNDLDFLFGNRMVCLDHDTNRLKWNEDDHHNYQGRFNDIKELCRNGNLVQFRGKMLLWEFPTEFLRCFDHVYILTYLFHGSPMYSYLEADRMQYQMMAIQDGKLVQWSEVDEAPVKATLRDLLTVYEGPANKIGTPQGKENPLSSSWFDRSTDQQLARLKGSTEYFFKEVAGTPSKVNGWTTFKKGRTSLAGSGYTKGFLPVNLRATNAHVDKASMAYLANIFYLPPIKGYFESRGIPVHEELYALSEMIQWLWRGQVRRGDSMQVYVPSERMRSLLKSWLEGDHPVRVALTSCP